jgi:hypothetical protein
MVIDGTAGGTFPDGSVQNTAAIAQINAFTATVAANALTITQAQVSLAFRSTTLNSGAATTVTGTPANLVVPANQSFGIATTGVVNRYAVLVLNDAGTLRLALSPLAGGVLLDETNFLTATNVVTNTLTTIYSTASTGAVAYRVVGFIDIAYTSGLGYSVAPQQVQGVGGQAFTAMSSLGYGQTWQNVTGSRANATTYYNTTGKPITVSITVLANGNGNGYSVNGAVVGRVDANAGGVVSMPYTFVVPPSGNYSASGPAGPANWSELR